MSIEPEQLCDEVTLYEGDCLEVLPTLTGIDAVVMDPPYGVEFQGKNTKHTHRSDGGYSSIVDSEEYVKSTVIPVVSMCVEKFGRVVVTPGARCNHLYPRPAELGCIYCPSGAGLGKWGFICFHPILYYGSCPYLANGMGHRPNGFHSVESVGKSEHPCQKPLGWMRWLVKKASLPGETILDPFAGSGTTAIAAMREGRKCILIEKDPAYCDIIRRRVREAAGVGSLFEGVT